MSTSFVERYVIPEVGAFAIEDRRSVFHIWLNGTVIGQSDTLEAARPAIYGFAVNLTQEPS